MTTEDVLPPDEIGQSQDELFDVVDADDNVLRQATRGEVHANGWMHRAVHCWIVRPHGELVLQMRSEHKDVCPLMWTSSASGHVDAGETYAASIVRELQEELGLPPDLAAEATLLATHAACWDLGNEHTHLFLLRTDATLTPDPREVAYLEERPVADWLAAIDEQPEAFSSSVVLLLRTFADRLTDTPK